MTSNFFTTRKVWLPRTMFFGQGGNNPFGVNFGFGHNFPQRFDEHYRVYPVSFCDKAHLEDGDKTRLHIEWPMLFKIRNEAVNRESHCGVLEFSAPEGSCYMPYWMMQNMFLTEGSILNIQNVTLPKATFVKIRPQSKDFLDITNPRAVLEASLRKFSCMTVGDTICLKYNNRNYLLDVREVRPVDAASIIETDCEVDFEAPADYVPPPPPTAAAAPAPAPSSLPFGGVPTMKREDLTARPASRGSGLGGLRMKKTADANTDAEALRAARLKRYEAFHGTGVSLSGATSTYSAPTTVTAASAPKPVAEEPKPEPTLKPFEGQGRRLR
ncbi:ubiquitin fusion degradation protein [Achlya hypogyna]|uniref:Ubiquitin fusion degradation protein n=1 Tax=Achlya hypogyna TaxID=1202772 RepID=A0A1V9YWR1_ACHHY|nr:ubiquitin fusion degradation protein [Achlya hypogyna]